MNDEKSVLAFAAPLKNPTTLTPSDGGLATTSWRQVPGVQGRTMILGVSLSGPNLLTFGQQFQFLVKVGALEALI